MSSEAPLVSVLMPVLNAADTVSRAVESILRQTYERFELLVLDDGSTDATRDLVAAQAAADGRIQLIVRDETRGVAERLNELVALARGGLIARMDADDLALPERLDLQVRFLAEHPEVDVVGSSVVVFGPDSGPLGVRYAPAAHEQIVRRPGVGFRLYHPTWLGRAEWFRRNPYRSAARRCEDQDVLMRSFPHSRFANITRPLLAYREVRNRLPASLTGRFTWVTRVLPSLVRNRPAAVAQGVAWHLARACIDVLTQAAGRDPRMPGRRMLRMSDAETEAWLQAFDFGSTHAP